MGLFWEDLIGSCLVFIKSQYSTQLSKSKFPFSITPRIEFRLVELVGWDLSKAIPARFPSFLSCCSHYRLLHTELLTGPGTSVHLNSNPSQIPLIRMFCLFLLHLEARLSPKGTSCMKPSLTEADTVNCSVILTVNCSVILKHLVHATKTAFNK